MAYEETTKSTGDEFAMRVRVATQGMQGILSVRHLKKLWSDPWVAFQLISHKILRWLVPLFLAVVFASTLALLGRPEFRLLLGLQLGFYGIALVTVLAPLHRHFKLLGVPLYFCTLNAAVLLGMREVVRGRGYAVWETVRR